MSRPIAWLIVAACLLGAPIKANCDEPALREPSSNGVKALSVGSTPAAPRGDVTRLRPVEYVLERRRRSTFRQSRSCQQRVQGNDDTNRGQVRLRRPGEQLQSRAPVRRVMFFLGGHLSGRSNPFRFDSKTIPDKNIATSHTVRGSGTFVLFNELPPPPGNVSPKSRTQSA